MKQAQEDQVTVSFSGAITDGATRKSISLMNALLDKKLAAREEAEVNRLKVIQLEQKVKKLDGLCFLFALIVAALGIVNMLR